MDHQRIALYGGSFDPPHIGHQALARLALEQLALDQLLVIPALTPVHRSLSGCVDGKTKLRWLQAMWPDEKRITVVDWELDAPTPTIASLQRFATTYPNLSPLLLLGSDAAAAIEQWVDYPNHRKLCNLAIFHRIGSNMVPPPQWESCSVEQWIRAPHSQCGRVITVKGLLPEISASRVRHCLQTGESIQGLVPEIIRDHVCQRYR